MSNPLASEFIIQNSLVTTKIARKIDGQLSIHGISFTEYLIMFHLFKSARKMMSRIALAESVGISASGITRLIAPMEKIGLVDKESNPRDARQSLVKLSKVGERLYKDATVSFEQCSKSVLSPLSDNQLGKLIELSNKIA